MIRDGETSNWECLDPWWSAYTRTGRAARSRASKGVLDRAQLADRWEGLDSWWRAHGESFPVTQRPVSARTCAPDRLTNCWEEIGPWWDSYTETGHEAAVTLSGLLERSNEEWMRSDAPFDTDPLSAELDGAHPRGPLRPNGEVAWSRWMARLLRPSAALVNELFDAEADRPPTDVVREVRLPKDSGEEGSFRRPDVLICHADSGVSLEVKLDDENYRKTAETARLVERHYDDREWTHALLLPKRRKNRLDSTVESPVVRHDGRLRIMWDDPGPIDVIHWRDVTAAIRTVLRRGDAADDHWASNAYLFCAAAEQRIANFQSRPTVERLASPSNVVDTARPIEIADTLGEQLSYLRETMEP